MWPFLAALALGAPPSSHLTGPTGSLDWTVTQTSEGVQITGRSPTWTVEHHATADLTPIRTVRTEASGREVITVWTTAGVEVHRPEGMTAHARPGVWDGDTLDIRLGQRVASGQPAQVFTVPDPDSGKLYKFDSRVLGQEPCGEATCTHLIVRLVGMLRLVGPSYEYWFAPNGQLMRFEGPEGTFAAP